MTTDEMLPEIERLAAQCLTPHAIAVLLGLPISAESELAFLAAVDRGKAAAALKLTSALERCAMKGSAVAARTLMEYAKAEPEPKPEKPECHVQIDVGSDIDALFAKQTTLLGGVYEVVSDEG
jgi:hypothetical protein